MNPCEVTVHAQGKKKRREKRETWTQLVGLAFKPRLKQGHFFFSLNWGKVAQYNLGVKEKNLCDAFNM